MFNFEWTSLTKDKHMLLVCFKVPSCGFSAEITVGLKFDYIYRLTMYYKSYILPDAWGCPGEGGEECGVRMSVIEPDSDRLQATITVKRFFNKTLLAT